ncbi:hypothetical protein BU25DRAFT_456811 [Macroventuria anomochaeta]|uniref:Uncharacterized protein n=1 Tax=Macroventuria anomochaeta TaxID=301207 RepID=A0ACB6S9H3_9PLEO|nr:uncharacterized protein BU25DRAFT_456811 [Macroventuria anomochaeta]KAF2629752.1 hypothetical protein BU25DRAFT_456811 [Macroventuria anomochaeta]
MTGEKKSSDLSSRLSVKRGGKLISKTLGKSSSPPSISAPPKAAVGASKVKKDEVQRHKNSFHDMLRGSPKEKDGGHALLNVPASGATRTPQSHGARGNISSVAANIIVAADGSRSLKHENPPVIEDDRLAELEKALAAAQDETAALRHELERVKQDAQASVEVSRYQAAEAHRQATPKSAIDSHQHNHPDSDDEINDREEDLINQNHNLRYRLALLQDQLITQSSTRPSEPLHSEADWNALTLRLHETEKESHARLQQLLSLKSSISSLTRTDSQASDSELAESFSQLANRVRELVVSNYRRTKMSFDNLPDASVRILRSIKVNYKEIEAADKLALYQAIVSRILMRIFDNSLVVGMPDQGIYAGLRVFAEGSQHTGTEFREWKRATLRMIEKGAPAATTLGWKNQELERLASEFEAIMLSISSIELTSSARLALVGTMSLAADLQCTLCLQKEDYRVIFFDTLDGKCHHFDDRAMEPVNDLESAMDESGEPYAQREFAFCVFPCLEKIASDTGHVVSKARVCCGVG